jgi:putative endonuclease
MVRPEVVRVRAKDALGRYGEQVAAQFLTDAGWQVLARNWRCRFGEADLVARDGAAVVICEVKTRRGDGYGGPFAAVGPRKLERLHRLAQCWVEVHGAPAELRFDVIGVWAADRGAARVEHLRGVT